MDKGQDWVSIDLYGYLNGTMIASSKTILENASGVPHPTYKIWFRQDQLIHNALRASIDQTITSAITKISTSKQAWDALHQLYANKSHT